MAKNNTTLSDWAKNGFVEKDGKLVKADTLVDKKPEKFKPIDESAYTGGIDPYIIDEIGLYENSGAYEMRREIALQQMKEFLDYETVKNATKIYIKPLTVNRAWRGQRFKTPEYTKYHEAVSLLLPNDLIVPDGLLKVFYEFGMSKNSDVDNPVKPLQDILQAKYGFNDNRIMELNIRKVFVKKGDEYILFRFESLE